MIAVVSVMGYSPAEVWSPEECVCSLDVRLGPSISRSFTVTYETNDVAYESTFRESSVTALFIGQHERSTRGSWTNAKYPLHSTLR